MTFDLSKKAFFFIFYFSNVALIKINRHKSFSDFKMRERPNLNFFSLPESHLKK